MPSHDLSGAEDGADTISFLCKIRAALNNDQPLDSHLRNCLHWPPYSVCSRARGDFCDQRIVREVESL
jgi:hypothetical protein